MTIPAINTCLDDLQDKPINSAVEQVPNDYNEKRNVNIAPLGSGNGTNFQFEREHSHLSSSEHTRFNTVDQLSAKMKISNAKVDSSGQAKAKPSRSLLSLIEWEGYIDSIDEKEFSVRMVNIRSKSPLPVDLATFSKDDISEYDRKLLRVGAIVRWIIGRERLPTGQIRNVAELYFRKLPAHSKKDYRRACEKAEALLGKINWENASKS